MELDFCYRTKNKVNAIQQFIHETIKLLNLVDRLY